MQRNPWMRPALQTSEAVFLPALLKRQPPEPLFSDRYSRVKPEEDPFRPVPQEGQASPAALSTYVRPRGSMAGRSVLRAAGMTGVPLGGRSKPRYYAPRPRTMSVRQRF